MKSRNQGKADKAKKEPRLPAAYIRSLVKHLSSTSTKNGDGQLQHKRHVRRRQHSTRPCQERLLNMDEARREFFTALRFHRASIKQQPPPYPYLPTMPCFKPITIHPTVSLGNYLQDPYPSNIAPPLYHQNPNFQDVNNPFSVYSSSSASASSSSSAAQKAEEVVGSPNVVRRDLHLAMDDEEMKEIRSLGEQHQVEWNDTVNLLTSAQWLEFLKSMEIGAEDATVQNNGIDPPNLVAEFPHLFMNTNESSSFQQNHFYNDYFQDADGLPCIDIGEVEGKDGEKQD